MLTSVPLNMYCSDNSLDEAGDFSGNVFAAAMDAQAVRPWHALPWLPRSHLSCCTQGDPKMQMELNDLWWSDSF